VCELKNETLCLLCALCGLSRALLQAAALPLVVGPHHGVLVPQPRPRGDAQNDGKRGRNQPVVKGDLKGLLKVPVHKAHDLQGSLGGRGWLRAVVGSAGAGGSRCTHRGRNNEHLVRALRVDLPLKVHVVTPWRHQRRPQPFQFRFHSEIAQ